ncbi:uncharacterized protein LOC62_02G001807 [Vanrija pseudolonga]|uniref:Uncharacterized protein n=1 Tax=Vanrija pseudolonga TaxID=143232 RepID=A0AAF0Y2L4_9TREE|nr:hypothetical protein LOC62_02G001807 [Vanrija pseudolonga]
MTATTEYPQTHENTVGRYGENAQYDVATIKAIIQESHFVNVSFVDLDGMPQCIPMVSAIEEAQDGLYVYIHGYHKARLVKMLPPESRVCITATLLDGLALAWSAYASNMNYRCAVLHGEVLDWDETTPDAQAAKMEAARQIVEGVCVGRWDECRQPSKAEMTTTGFLKIKVLSASAKISSGCAGEEKRDLDDDEVTSKLWAGVIPTKLTLLDPIDSPDNKVPVPKTVKDFIATHNAKPVPWPKE